MELKLARGHCGIATARPAVERLEAGRKLQT
jgi:hypothetical protein